ncbi:PREDICTED: uncharacterized protein LOC108773409 [Cyphomyrmex costatus]|uniref:Uncharacterized protein C7orf36 n=1 Tax=Cyphomyrmex costatus TaxID=456900 RepID=A0A195CTP0_9HYME|nr:PREDICTED: uncharacterized protein LOC108773409 [Cyphomyrmex costatus]KYN03499.1 Uncharacterized protein C7orf36 [Cyphomyrmex costatus]
MEDVIQTTKDDLAKDDESLNIASKCWKRITDAAVKTGYREGIQDGADSVLQEGFDIGYKDGFETAFILGRYKGLAAASTFTLEHPTDVAVALEKTRRGACWICNVESQTKPFNPHENASFSEILSKQRENSAEVINRLHEYFKLDLEKSDTGINSTV